MALRNMALAALRKFGAVALILVSVGARGAIDSPPPSPWAEGEKSQAIALLKQHSVDVLVTPFQVEGGGFDAVARNLMARSLASKLQRNGGLAVADPTLVEQALGSSGREFEDSAILELADITGASLILTGYVGHNGGGEYSLRIERLSLEGDGERQVVGEYSGAPFNDELLPYFDFLERRDGLLQTLAELEQSRRSASKISDAYDVPESIEAAMEMARRSEAESALLLQFVGVLHTPSPRVSRSTERVFERSLIALESVDPKSSHYALLRARALYYLHRRPAALAALGKAGDEAEKAMLAVLNGDLDSLKALVPKIRSPLLRLMATAEYERMRMTYGRSFNEEGVESLVEAYPEWAPWIYQALVSSNIWRHYSHVPTKHALDVHFPELGFSLDAFVTASAVTEGGFDEARLANRTLRHVAASRQSGYGRWRQQNGGFGPFPDDFLDLARDAVLVNVLDEIKHAWRNQGRPNAALSLARDYAGLLAGHPGFTVLHGQVEWAVSDKREGSEQSNLKASGYRKLREGTLWSLGQTGYSGLVAKTPQQFFPGAASMSAAELDAALFSNDWPSRYYWKLGIGRTQEERNVHYEHCLAYTSFSLSCLAELHASYSMVGEQQPERAAKLLEDNRHRFRGHPMLTEFLGGIAREQGDEAAAEAILQRAVESGSPDWDAYDRLGSRLAKQGKAEAARDLFLKFPGFHQEATGTRVRLSNHAYEAGSLLFWAGEYEAARPLYELAAGYRTGSGAGMASRVRLALMDGDLQTAAAETLRRAQRYQSRYAYRDFVGYLAIFGDIDNAITLIDSFGEEYKHPEIWSGALVAQRAAEVPEDEIVDWAFRGGREAQRTSRGSLALRHVFMTQVIDRNIPESLPALLNELDPDGPVTRDRRGYVRHGPGRTYFPSASFGVPREQTLRPELPEGPIDNLLAAGSRGLRALQSGDVEKAFSILDDASRNYDLGEFLAYYALAAGSVGERDRIETFIANSIAHKTERMKFARQSNGNFFDEYLANAYLAAAAGNHKAALDYLVRVNADLQHTVDRRIYTRYQILEAAERIYRETGEDQYRAFGLNLARANAVIEPMQAWIHAFVANFSKDDVEQVRALARALHLDPRSKRALAQKSELLERARELLRDGYPLPAPADTTT